jgi:hypothetical protein
VVDERRVLRPVGQPVEAACHEHGGGIDGRGAVRAEGDGQGRADGPAEGCRVEERG